MTTQICVTVGWLKAQIREQMSGPDLHVFTLKFLALYGFFHVFGVKKIKIKFDPKKVKKTGFFRAKNLSVNT